MCGHLNKQNENNHWRKQPQRWVKWYISSACVSSPDVPKFKLSLVSSYDLDRVSSIITFFDVFVRASPFPFKMKIYRDWSHQPGSCYDCKSSLACLWSEHFWFSRNRCLHLTNAYSLSISSPPNIVYVRQHWHFFVVVLLANLVECSCWESVCIPKKRSINTVYHGSVSLLFVHCFTSGLKDKLKQNFINDLFGKQYNFI